MGEEGHELPHKDPQGCGELLFIIIIGIILAPFAIVSWLIPFIFIGLVAFLFFGALYQGLMDVFHMNDIVGDALKFLGEVIGKIQDNFT